MSKTVKKSAYADAGVNIDVMMTALKRSKKEIRSTFTKGVLGDVGAFGGLFKTPGKDRILVSSIDGVGTKLKVALLAGRHHTVGQDLVNHCVNDILVQGARPLFFMDYIGASCLDAKVFEQVIKGLCKASRENGCALLGGETAEMPGLYPEGEYDLVGTIVGEVEKKKLVDGRKIKKGHVLIGLPSTGLQTNGFSLARKVLFEQAGLKVDDVFPGLKKTVADVLLAVHKSYLHPVMALMEECEVSGMAHITGGGLVDNVPRVLPEGLSAVFDRSAWKVPQVFQYMQEAGGVDRDEMYRVFNMGIGMVLVLRAKDEEKALSVLRKAGEKALVIGEVTRGAQAVVLQH
ncbi:MAG: phosphoribosylformylglycinamidine cyclo-ligase [Kiritimatiellae bacterium]|nr:phosphoribosylformylglycinamidine cyclo-ligase [Kiritimatiellia bacterium]